MERQQIRLFLTVFFSILLLGLVFLLRIDIRYAIAQSYAPIWGQPTVLSNTPGESKSAAIAFDHAGILHVIWDEDFFDDPSSQYPFVEFSAIYYTRLDRDTWTQPLDVLYSPDSPTDLQTPSIAVDTGGYVHVIWISGHNALYSRSHIQAPISANSWLKPVRVSSDLPLSIRQASIIVDNRDMIHICFAIEGIYPSVGCIYSSNSGDSWSQPMILSTSSEKGLIAGSVRLVSDDQGRVHLGFTLHNREGYGAEIYYAQSLDQGQTWTHPFLVATKPKNGYEVDWLNIAVVNNQIHLVWEGGERPYRQHRLSIDGGKTWSDPQQIMADWVSETGWSELLVDSANVLHIFSPLRGTAAGVKYGAGNLAYSQWENKGTRWRDPHYVAHTESMLAVQGSIENGNQVHLVWHNQKDGEIWHLQGELDAPYVAPQSLKTEVVATPETTHLVMNQLATPTSALKLNPAETQISSSPGIGINLIWVVLSVGFFLITVIFIKIRTP